MEENKVNEVKPKKKKMDKRTLMIKIVASSLAAIFILSIFVTAMYMT